MNEKKKPIKLVLQKIDIDVLSDSTLKGVQGGYVSQQIDSLTRCVSAAQDCYSDGQTYCDCTISDEPSYCYTECAWC